MRISFNKDLIYNLWIFCLLVLVRKSHLRRLLFQVVRHRSFHKAKYLLLLINQFFWFWTVCLMWWLINNSNCCFFSGVYLPLVFLFFSLRRNAAYLEWLKVECWLPQMKLHLFSLHFNGRTGFWCFWGKR